MHKKHHEKFKILDILDVTTQAREGIETRGRVRLWSLKLVTTQAREGIETDCVGASSACPWQKSVPGKNELVKIFFVHNKPP